MTDIEIAVLGALLAYPHETSSYCRDLHIVPESFQFDSHRKLYTLLMDQVDSGTDPFDMVTCLTYLMGTGEVDQHGGIELLSSLPERAPVPARVLGYVSELRRAWGRRRLHEAGQWLAHAAHDPRVSIDDMVAELYSAADAAQRRERDARFASGVDIAKDIESAFYQEPTAPPMPTGVESLDKVLGGGLVACQTTVLAARPGVGKTAIALNMAWRIARSGNGVLFCSLEQPREQVSHRLGAIISGLPMWKFRSKSLSDGDWATIHGRDGIPGILDEVRNAPLWIDDRPGQTLGYIRAACIRARQRAEERGTKLRLLVVDYLQRMGRPRGENRDDSLGQTARGLADLAREEGVALLELSQLNRAVESRKGGKPQLSDLRESGIIEEAADIVLGLYRPHMGAEGGRDRELGVVGLKHRHHAPESTTLEWDGACLRISDFRGQPDYDGYA